MTITVVCDVLGEENNGTTIASMNLIRHLKQRGHTVRVLCADRSRMGEEDVFVVPSRSFGKLLNAYVAKVGVTLAKPEDETVRAALDGVDHVHIMLPFALGRRAMEIARENGISVTAGFHMQAENFTSYIKLNKIQPLNRAVYRYVYRRVYRHVDAIHYPTQFIRNIFETSVGHTTRRARGTYRDPHNGTLRPRKITGYADQGGQIFQIPGSHSTYPRRSGRQGEAVSQAGKGAADRTDIPILFPYRDY